MARLARLGEKVRTVPHTQLESLLGSCSRRSDLAIRLPWLVVRHTKDFLLYLIGVGIFDMSSHDTNCYYGTSHLLDMNTSH